MRRGLNDKEMKESSSNQVFHALDYWQVIRNRFGVILLAFLLVSITAAVITHILPRQYLGKVRLEINKVSEWDVFQTTTLGPGQDVMGLNFVQTQFEIISSKETLYGVIDRLDLVKRWELPSRMAAYHVLQGKIRAEEVRGTDLIDVFVYHTDPDEAAELANEVADRYRSRREEEELGRSNRALGSLEEQLDKQRGRVEVARMNMLELMRKYRIVDLGGSQVQFGDGEPVTGLNEVIRKSNLGLYESQRENEQIAMQLETLENLEGDDLIQQAASLNLRDNTVSLHWPKYQGYHLELRQLTDSGLGPKHPRMVAVSGQIEETHEILMSGIESIKASLRTQLEIASKSHLQMADRHREKEDDSMEDRMRHVEYTEAKKDYEMQKEMLKDMQSKLYAESIDITMPKTPIVIHEKAEPTYLPVRPNVALNLLLGSIVGLGFGLGLAFFLEYLDTSVKSLEDVERYLEVPVLAVIPKGVGVLLNESGLSPDAEAYRILRTNIEFNRKRADANSITVVSGSAGEGKSTTLVNLAYICAQGGYSTLMIDGDLRRPKLHTFFKTSNSVGLTNYLTTELPLEDVVQRTPVDNLFFMPSGILPADAAGILNSRRMSELIRNVKGRFDLVLIDSPPILGVSDASVLASEVDLTMMVVQHRKLPRSMVLRVKQAIENVGGNLLGVVLNNVDIQSDNSYQYYTSYYTYYSPMNSSGASHAGEQEPAVSAGASLPPAQSAADEEKVYEGVPLS